MKNQQVMKKFADLTAKYEFNPSDVVDYRLLPAA